MSYNPNIPNATDLLSNSQGQIKTNFQTANTSFGVDHYSFDNGTASNGFHNKVTTPLIVGGIHPTTTTDPKFYAMQDSANLGVIQYSRGPSNAVPTPVNHVFSPTAPIIMNPGATINIFDFTGLTSAMFQLYLADTTLTARYDYLTGTWNGTNFRGLFENASGFASGSAGNILRVTSTAVATVYNNVFWTLVFLRINS